MYNDNLCSLVVSDREFTVTPSNMCGNSLYLKLYELVYIPFLSLQSHRWDLVVENWYFCSLSHVQS